MKQTKRIRITLQAKNEAALCCLISQLEKVNQRYGISKRQSLESIIYWKLTNKDEIKLVTLNTEDIAKMKESNSTTVIDIQQIKNESILKWLNNKNDARQTSTKTKNLLRSTIEISEEDTRIDVKKLYEIVIFFGTNNIVPQYSKKTTLQNDDTELFEDTNDIIIQKTQKAEETPNKAITSEMKKTVNLKPEETGENKASAATNMLQGLGSSALNRGLKL